MADERRNSRVSSLVDNRRIKSLFLCDCWSEGVTIELEKDDSLIEMAFWSAGRGPFATSLRERIRWCWHILTTGTYFNDEMCISTSVARSMAAKLNELADEAEKNTLKKLSKEEQKEAR
jgi:hypothetical protein